MTGSSVVTNLVRAAHQLRSSTNLPRLEAELLLAHVLRCPRESLHAHPERTLDPAQQNGYQELLERRTCGEPLPYLTGYCEFYGLKIAVNSGVLIPRPETETLVELALHRIRRYSSSRGGCDSNTPTGRRPVVADVGTGSGCIAIALVVQNPRCHIYALDISTEALSLARANAFRHEVAGQITFLESDLLDALPEPADLLVANPPYIAHSEWPELQREVREYEPRLSLYGGRDGLQVIKNLLNQAAAFLRPGGAVLIEIGATQGPAASSIAVHAFPTAEIRIHTDLAGHDRVLSVETGHRPEQSSCAGDGYESPQSVPLPPACL